MTMGASGPPASSTKRSRMMPGLSAPPLTTRVPRVGPMFCAWPAAAKASISMVTNMINFFIAASSVLKGELQADLRLKRITRKGWFAELRRTHISGVLHEIHTIEDIEHLPHRFQILRFAYSEFLGSSEIDRGV